MSIRDNTRFRKVYGAFRARPVVINTEEVGIIVAGGDPGAQYLVLALTASLTNERLFVPGTGISATDGGAGGSYTLTIDDDIVATVSGTTFTGPVIAPKLTGSLQRLSTGETAFAGTGGVAVTTASNGQVQISGSVYADRFSSYLTVNSEGSPLPGSRAIQQGTGIKFTDTGAGVDFDVAIDNNVVATVSGTTFTGQVNASNLSGSLQRLVSGLSYLVAGKNVDITSASNGQITVQSKPMLLTFDILRGVSTTSTALTGSKQSIGTFHYNPSLFNVTATNYTWKALVDTSETPVPVAVDLYDVYGHVYGSPGTIESSILTSTSQTTAYVSADLTSVFSAITASVIIEARLWKTISGSVTSSVSCRGAWIDVTYLR
jgi:hypothetical protein